MAKIDGTFLDAGLIIFLLVSAQKIMKEEINTMRSLKKLFALSLAMFAFAVVSSNAQALSGNQATEHSIFKKIQWLQNYGVFDHIAFQYDNGTVILTGKVDSIGTKDQAAKAVKDVPGVTNVINNIEQLPASPYDDRIRRAALRTLSTSGPSQYFGIRDPDVRIIVENGRITLEGYVSNSTHSNWLNTLANGITGVFSVQNNLIVGKNVLR